MNFSVVVHGPQRMNPADFSDSMTFTQVPAESCYFLLYRNVIIF